MDQVSIFGHPATWSVPSADGPAATWDMDARPDALLLRRTLNTRGPSVMRSGPLAGLGTFLLLPRPLSLLLLCSFACSVAFCLHLFSMRFLLGISDYWQAPRGLVPASWADMSTSISGYYYFVRDAWTLPLFQTTKLGVPHPVSAIFTDSIPVVAICGRLLYRATGLVVNPYGAWTALCFIASALSMTGLVAALGQRGLAATLMATVSGLCMPALLERWGHLAQMAQWEIIAALIIYFCARSPRRPIGLIVSALALAAVAVWTQAYLFAMVIGILAAAFAQAITDRRLRLPRAAKVAALFAIVLPGVMFVSGYFSNQGSVAGPGFGLYSMNLLSPIIPQFSALLPILGDHRVDGTGGQYEGFSYLGAGILVLVIMTLPWLRRAVAGAWRDHAWLLALMFGCVLFSISNEVYVGNWHVLSVPLPGPVLEMASIFRSSGRFIWPCLYLLTAAAIVAAPSLWGRAGAWLLAVAAMVQFVDTTPLQSALAARTSAAAATPLSEIRWADVIRQHDLVRVVPTFGCLSDMSSLAAQAAVELQVLASRENVATNTVYAARHSEDCTQPAPASLAPQELRVYLLSVPHAGPPADIADTCAASSAIAVCSRRLGASDLAALVMAEPEQRPAFEQ
jgi:hypothetical protein